MRTFDLYSPAGTPSEGFFAQPLSSGTMVWIDKAGFFDGYFRDRQTKDLLEFVVLNGGATAIPRDVAAFEKLRFVEAEILEPTDNGAKIVVRSATTLGEWARSVYTLGKANWESVPEASRPDLAILEGLKEQFRAKEGVVWVSDTPPASPEAPTAVYLFKCDFDKRCLILTSSASSCYLVKL